MIRPALAFALVMQATTTTCPRVPRYVPLSTPFPLTYGGTPVPGNGVGVAYEGGKALRGPRGNEGKITSFQLAAGVADRVSASVGPYSSGGEDAPSGTILRLKLRLGGVLGARSSTSLHFASASMQSTVGNTANERLSVLDFALPTEFLLWGDSVASLAAVLGPRFTFAMYDSTYAAHTRTAYRGLLAGVHAKTGRLHMFAEATVTRVPTPQGGTRTAVVPVFGVMLHAGSAFKWGREH